MAVDTSIYGQIRPFRMRDPIEARANALAVQQAEQNNALRAQQMQYAQEDRMRADQRRQGVNALLSRGLSPEELEGELMRAGYAEEAFKFGKERRENAKTAADTRATEVKTQIEQINRNAQLLRSANDQQSWSSLRQLIAQAEGPDVASKFPEQFDPRIRDAFVSATLKEADRLQSETARRGQDMTDARTRAEGAANRAVQMRGQNMTDARQRDRMEASAGRPPAKPIPTSALKLQQEEVDALQTFRGLDADLSSIEQQLESGALSLGPVANIGSELRNRTGFSNEQSRNFESLKAKLENMRNAILLLNKGVQTEGDAQRAMNELMSNLNDQKVVEQRLAEIRKINQRAANIRKNNVNVIRQNFGAEPLDFEALENQPSAVGAQQTSVQPSAPRPGQVIDGYRFKGGNPADPKSWERQ